MERETKLGLAALVVLVLPLIGTLSAVVFLNTGKYPTVLSTVRLLCSLIRDGSSNGDGVRPEASVAEPRPFRWSFHVWQNAAGSPASLVSGNLSESSPEGDNLLLRPVPGAVQPSKADASEERSDDAPQAGIVHQASGSGEEGAPDIDHH